MFICVNHEPKDEFPPIGLWVDMDEKLSTCLHFFSNFHLEPEIVLNKNITRIFLHWFNYNFLNKHPL